MNHNFPFGSQLQKVEQQDKSPKEVFVLGVYASAVHAKWIDRDGTTKVQALAVASEPYIFWRGDGAKEIIDNISMPPELGTLIPADPRFNGPSGNILDEMYLDPLGFNRKQAWLCDIIPYSRMNQNQLEAIKTHYEPVYKQYGLPRCTIPKFRLSELNSDDRRKEIVAELQQSKAETIILLGDYPIKYFLSYYTGKQSVKEFGGTPQTYGEAHKINIEGKLYKVIPLVHPRQAGRLGASKHDWTKLHQFWVMNKSLDKYGKLLKSDFLRST